MSLFNRLSKVFEAKDVSKKPSTPKKSKQPKEDVKQSRRPKRVHKPSLDSRPIKKEDTQKFAEQASVVVREAQTKARELMLEAKDEALKIRESAESKARELQKKYDTFRSDLESKRHELDRTDAVLKEKERLLNKIETENTKVRDEVETLKRKLIEKLEEVGTLTRDEARKQILEAVEKRSVKDVALRIREAEDKAQEEADQKAQDILVEAMMHGATDYVAEYSVSVVEIPNEDIKGRLIGRDGRNIRAFERATGVDLDLDESPGSVRLSSFDSVRREIAKQALIRLIKDGRIQPTRIEEYVARAKRDVEKVMFEEGKKLCHAVGAFHVPRELIAYLGRFKYRFSYGQNMIAHTLEETKIGMALAREVGANVDTVRLGCLFHDIGKVVMDEEGSHVDLGVKLLKKYDMSQPVVDAVAQHHEDTPFTSNESVLVYIADAISGARPGARYENYDEYVKRLENLEKIAMEQKGVSEVYAIQAGREIRVIVDHKELSDDEAVVTAEKIRDRIKAEMTYPGTVTVNVIREVRASAVAT